eukprot:Colp12_sorted_trinity150504_noHs@9886
MTYQATDSKKKEFRAYLEKSGVIDALTKVLVTLYEEPDKPSNSLEFIKNALGTPQGLDVEGLKTENEELKKKNEELLAKVAELEKQLAELSSVKEETDEVKDA